MERQFWGGGRLKVSTVSFDDPWMESKNSGGDIPDKELIYRGQTFLDFGFQGGIRQTNADM